MIAVYLRGGYRCACIVCCKSITYGEGFQNAIVDINIILQFRASQIHEDCTIIFHNYRYHLELNHNYHQFGMHRITSAFLRAAYATIVSEVEISLR
jgi:hypothetical protein